VSDDDAKTTTPRLAYYLALIEDTTKLTDRRQTTNDLYVGLNVVFFTGLGALIYASRLDTWWVTGLYAAISALALALNLTWIRLINRYRRLIRLRIEYMQQLEIKLQALDVFVAPQVDSSKKRSQNRQASGPVTGEGPEQPAAGPGVPGVEPVGIFAAESSQLYRPGSHFGFSGLERGLIVIFMVSYVVATIGVAVATYLVTTHVLGPLHL